jgi:hypothetical protein
MAPWVMLPWVMLPWAMLPWAMLPRGMLFDFSVPEGGRIERRPDRPERPLFGVDIRPRRAQPHQHQRAAAIRRSPYAVMPGRTAARALKLRDQVLDFAGRVGGQGALHQHPCGRSKVGEVALHRRP